MTAPAKDLSALRIDRSQAAAAGRRGRWLALLALLLLAGGAGGWWYFSNNGLSAQSGAAKPPTPAPATAAATPATGNESPPAAGAPANRILLNASGYVTTRLKATVSSKVTGKISEVLVEEGMKVEKDQILAKIDDSNARAALRLAEARLDAARLELEEAEPLAKHAEEELKRLNALRTNKSISRSDLSRATAEALMLRGRLSRLKAGIHVAERQVEENRQFLDDTIIRAPFAGVVTTKDSQPGEMISPMSAGGGFTRTGICTLVDMTSLEIEVDVSESHINRVRPGQPAVATLDAYPDWRIPCKVIAIIPTADRQKATVKVRVGFSQIDPRILPQMGVKVAFQDDTPAS
jgi:RND family efflux transporter MFP subunit